MITGQQSFDEIFHAHTQGQSAILGMRGPAQLDTPVGRSLFAQTNRVLLWRDCASAYSPRFGYSDWPDVVYSCWLGELSARLSVKVVDVIRLAKDVREVPDLERNELWDQSLKIVCQAAVELDREIQQSLDKAPENWRWKSISPLSRSPSPFRPSSTSSSSAHPNSSFEGSPSPNTQFGLSTPFSTAFFAAFPGLKHDVRSGNDEDDDEPEPTSYPRRIDVYPTVAVAMLWNTIRVVRLPLFSTMRDLLLLNTHSPRPQSNNLPTPSTLRATLHTTILDITASLPFLLGDITSTGALKAQNDTAGERGGLAMNVSTLWMLHKICRVPGLEPGLRAWIIEVIERIGTRGGIRQGLNLAKMHKES